MTARSYPLALVLAALTACPEPPPPPPRPPAPPPPQRLAEELVPLVAPRAISHPAGFDLVAWSDVVGLVWGATPWEGGGIRMIRLAPTGAPHGGEILVARGSNERAVQDVAASANAGRLGIAWIEQSGPLRTVRATHGSGTTLTFATDRELGETVDGSPDARGRLTILTDSNGDSTVTYQTTGADCRATEGTCARYVHRRIDERARGPRGIETLEVPTACPNMLVGSAYTRDAMAYGVCAREASVLTRIFVIRPSTSYAGFADVNPGCEPVGLLATADGAFSVARCGSELSAAVVGEDARVTHRLSNARAAASCERTGMRLRWSGESGSYEIPLGPSAMRVDFALPREFAPVGARAVWTGQALLVAQRRGREVAVRRYQCVRGILTNTTPS